MPNKTVTVHRAERMYLVSGDSATNYRLHYGTQIVELDIDPNTGRTVGAERRGEATSNPRCGLDNAKLQSLSVAPGDHVVRCRRCFASEETPQ